LRGKGRPVVKYRDTLRSSVQKTAEPIEMLRVVGSDGPKESYVSAEVLRDVAIATNFGTKIAI